MWGRDSREKLNGGRGRRRPGLIAGLASAPRWFHSLAVEITPLGSAARHGS